MNQSEFDKIEKIAIDLGGKINLIENQDLFELSKDKKFSMCPFNGRMGINWFDKIIFLSKELELIRATEVIHEMGHVFACKHSPNCSMRNKCSTSCVRSNNYNPSFSVIDNRLNDPESYSELDFLGWEILVSIKAGVSIDTWLKENGDYVINSKHDFGQLSHLEELLAVAEAIKLSADIGLINVGMDKVYTVR